VIKKDRERDRDRERERERERERGEGEREIEIVNLLQNVFTPMASRSTNNFYHIPKKIARLFSTTYTAHIHCTRQ
jgi:hypothetical protein